MEALNRYLVRALFLLLLCFPAMAVQAQQKDVPRRGEGITTFLQRHGRSPRKYYAAFIELNRDKLGRSRELRLGVSYVIPPLESAAEGKRKSRRSYVNEPLFGKRFDDVKVTSNRLAGCCFYVVSGHGGPDPGAIGRVGKHELHEDEYAYDIALRLARYLLQEGADVRIIIRDAKDGIRNDAYLSNSKRETCMGDPIPLNQVRRLQQRCDKINALYARDRKKYSYCRAIFIHVDSQGKGKLMDVYFYHSAGSKLGKRLATSMRSKFKTMYGIHQPKRGFTVTVSERGLYVLRNTTPVSVFVELGNIQNQFDLRRLIDSSNREALAKWLKDGFVKDVKQ